MVLWSISADRTVQLELSRLNMPGTESHRRDSKALLFFYRRRSGLFNQIRIDGWRQEDDNHVFSQPLEGTFHNLARRKLSQHRRFWTWLSYSVATAKHTLAPLPELFSVCTGHLEILLMRTQYPTWVKKAQRCPPWPGFRCHQTSLISHSHTCRLKPYPAEFLDAQP